MKSKVRAVSGRVLPQSKTIATSSAGPIAPSFLPDGYLKGEVDEFAWMARSDRVPAFGKAMKSLIAAERRHVAATMKGTEDFQRLIVNELTAWATAPAVRSQQSQHQQQASGFAPAGELLELSAAERLGDYLYYSGRPVGAESLVYYRRRVPAQTPGALLHPLQVPRTPAGWLIAFTLARP